ncbi:MAG: DUF4956 domain-containing protein [Phycisphaerales bacterium JB038]
MERLQQFMSGIDDRAPDFGLEALVLSLLLSLVLGQLVAWTYSRTHAGLSYSRSYTQSLVLMTMVVSMVMFVIGDNIITAFGLIGALALIRFRNVMKDTRDTVFVFFALVLGMAAGSQRYGAAILGAAALVVVTFYLHWTSFGSIGRYDGHLTCRVSASPETGEGMRSVLRRFCRRVDRVSTREGAGFAEYIFHIALRDRRRGQEMTEQLEALEGVGEAILVLGDEFTEV